MTQVQSDSQRHGGPVLDRRITLTLQGDWGQANLHRICGWLAQEVGDRCEPGSEFLIRSGRGGADAIHAVLSGQADVALLTPTVAMGMVPGAGPLAVDRSDRLRALGTLPQRDRLVTCVDAELGVRSMQELAGRMSQLRIATSPDDGVNLVGLAAHRQLQAIGIEAAALDAAGGSWLYDERPFPAIAAFRDGAANVLVHEAIMMPAWQRITDHRPVVYLDTPAVVLDTFNAWHWPSAVVPQGYLPSLEHDLTALEFSDFLLLCTDALPDDIAALIAWCMVATREALEVQYRHIPPDRSPLSYPLDPQAIATTPIALHPAAAKAYAAFTEDQRPNQALIWD
ncbi:hypothetical protein OQ968_02280 [Mycobacterium sp. 663a-19]|uniref:hypothetical protein n=1 Tax=Mycobacterium sp. 663a-19 TaxID=2986148 RepID=UPI002D1E6F9C|nr:hypothetical protein [Mycobacterium sp. 663a-19]MEB3980085.1 hypothetical protein [Mycobacterium sp. 663a-19]